MDYSKLKEFTQDIKMKLQTRAQRLHRLIPLSNMLNRQGIGYAIDDQNIMTHLLYMDDLKIFGSDERQLRQSMHIEWSLDKTTGQCTTVAFKRGLWHGGLESRGDKEDGQEDEEIANDARHAPPKSRCKLIIHQSSLLNLSPCTTSLMKIVKNHKVSKTKYSLMKMANKIRKHYGLPRQGDYPESAKTTGGKTSGSSLDEGRALRENTE
ncbi:unconventional myosin-X-like protein [Labeo rohita]|uniref:Unconventional myosin-X-like protein n=1 Tax=Labeo rohita TaxID=84645 RepID=A0A498N3T5_LABRO|nr:unconventional myosin-X-like protein [Labeo rohita]